MASSAEQFIDRLLLYDELSPNPATRQRKWAEKVHRPIEESKLAAIRSSNDSRRPYGNPTWVKRLAKRLDLDLTIRPRGRPRKL